MGDRALPDRERKLMVGSGEDKSDGAAATKADGRRKGVQIQSVARSIKLLTLVARRRTDGSGKALAEAAGLPVPTAHHLLATLVAEGLLSRGPHARYELGPLAAVLSEAVQHEREPPSYLLAGLNELVARTRETCYIAAWRQGEIRLLASMPGRQAVQVAVPIGPYSDAHARASGKLFLAYVGDEAREAFLDVHPLRPLTSRTITDRRKLEADLQSVCEAGYAIDEEEFEDGVCCVSVPVLSEGVLLAAYSMSVPAQRWSKDRDDLIATAIEVGRSTGANWGARDA
jgi:DNA-binding IclR family transcriptional regulator